MIVSTAGNELRMRLDFAEGVYTSGNIAYPSAAAIAEVRNSGPGGIAVAPDGALRVSPVGQPRRAAGVGVRLDQASENLLSMRNAAPTSVEGWTLLSSRPAGATITLVNDRAALEAAGIFAELLAANLMNGQVVRFYNPSPDTDFAIPFFGTNGEIFSISAYVRAVQGSAYISVTAGGGQTPVFTGPAWRRIGRRHNVGQQARFVVQPQSEVFVILAQVERGNITAPIIINGSPARRAADVLELRGSHIFAAPHTVLVEIDIEQLDGVERRVMTLDNGIGGSVTTSRRNDNSLSLVPSSTLRRPRLPRVFGPGRLRVAQRVCERGLTIAAQGQRAEDPFTVPPRGLNRMVIGASIVGDLPLTGWVRSVEVLPALTDDDLEKITILNDGVMALDIARYVSPTGNDAADGKTPATAWRTLAKAGETLNGAFEGVHFYLQRGGEWPETLRPRNYSFYRAYGQGAAPKFGRGQAFACDENAASNWWLSGLHLTGATQRGVNSFGASGIAIENCEVSDCGSITENNAGGIVVRGNSRQATAALLSAPAGSDITGYRTTEAGLTGNFTITCTVAGAGAASRWQVRRPDNSVIAVASGGQAFNSGGIAFTITSTSATKVGDQFVVRNLPFAEIPYPTNAVCNDLLVRNTYIHDIFGAAAGDDLYSEGIGGIGIFEGNRLEIPIGRAADCLQVGRCTSLYHPNPMHAIVRNNYMSMQGKDTDSGKGCCVLLCGSALVESNHMDGLNFCLSLGLERGGIIRWNHMRDAKLNPYSWAIGVGGDTDITLLEVYENEVEECIRAFSFSGTGNTTMTLAGRVARLQYRGDVTVRDNVIRACSTGIFVDRPTSGRLQFNKGSQVATMIERRTMVVPPNGAATELRIGFNRVSA